MNAKSTLDLLNSLVRKVIRSFYPELFIVVDELISNDQYIQAQQLADALNLTPQLVEKSLHDLVQKRFVIRRKYGNGEEVEPFYAFNYHSFINVVRYKIAMLKKKEQEKRGNGGASAGSGGYICVKCNRAMKWQDYVKLVGDGSKIPTCPFRGCGGTLQKESKLAAEGMKPLESFSKVLQRLAGAPIPELGTRLMERKIEEAARREDEARGEGGPRYEMPVISQGANTNYIVQWEGSTESELLPPELAGLIESDPEPVRAGLPPWLKSQQKEDEDVDLVDEEEKIEVKMDRLELVRGHSSTPLPEVMEAYAPCLAKQLDNVSHQKEENGFGLVLLDWDPTTPPISVGGSKVPVNEIGEEHLTQMTAEEYKAYFQVYEEECEKRRAKILASAAIEPMEIE